VNQEKQIGEWTYTVPQLPATQALKLTARVMNVLGPALERGGAGDQKAFVAALMSNEKLDEHLDFFVTMLGPTCLAKKFDERGQEVTCHLNRADFDKHFVGRMSDLSEWLMFALEVNLGDFLGGLLAKAGAQKAAAARALQSPSPAAKSG
jgi:hypothetical protein